MLRAPRSATYYVGLPVGGPTSVSVSSQVLRHLYYFVLIFSRVCCAMILRGTILNRIYGKHKNLPGTYLPIFNNHIRSYLLLCPVIVPIVRIFHTSSRFTALRLLTYGDTWCVMLCLFCFGWGGLSLPRRPRARDFGDMNQCDIFKITHVLKVECLYYGARFVRQSSTCTHQAAIITHTCIPGAGYS